MREKKYSARDVDKILKLEINYRTFTLFCGKTEEDFELIGGPPSSASFLIPDMRKTLRGMARYPRFFNEDRINHLSLIIIKLEEGGCAPRSPSGTGTHFRDTAGNIVSKVVDPYHGEYHYRRDHFLGRPIPNDPEDPFLEAIPGTGF